MRRGYQANDGGGGTSPAKSREYVLIIKVAVRKKRIKDRNFFVECSRRKDMVLSKTGDGTFEVPRIKRNSSNVAKKHDTISLRRMLRRFKSAKNNFGCSNKVTSDAFSKTTLYLANKKIIFFNHIHCLSMVIFPVNFFVKKTGLLLFLQFLTI